MANHDYIFKRADSTNAEFVVRPYTANGPASPTATTLYNNAGTAATTADTSLAFVGKGVVEYNVVQNNLLYLLENCANKSRPVYPIQGQIWYKNIDFVDSAFPSDPTVAGVYIWDGGWHLLPMSDNLRTTLEMRNLVVKNVGAPVDATDAATKGYADTKVAKAGDTMTGFLTLHADPTASLHAVTKQYADAKVSSGGGVMTGYLTLNADPVNPMHAATKQYTDERVLRAGDTMTGYLVLHADPVDPMQAVTKQYVDGFSLDGLGDTVITFPNTNDVLVFDGTNWINSASPIMAYVPISGGTMTGPLVLDGSTPTLPQHAVPKQYVDNLVIDDMVDVLITGAAPNDTLMFNGTAWINVPTSSGGGADGVVWAGSINNSTGALTLNRTAGLPDVTIAGVAPFTHYHSSTAISFELGTTYPQSSLISHAVETGNYPSCPVSEALTHLDQLVTRLSRPVQRQVIIGDGTTSTYTLNHNMEYVVTDNRLQVYCNGVKQYENERGKVVVSLGKVASPPPFPSVGTLTGLNPSTSATPGRAYVTADTAVAATDIAVLSTSAGTYYFKVAVDGAAAVEYSISIISLNHTFTAIASLLDTALTAAGVDVIFDDANDRFVFSRTTTGPTSTVVVTAGTTGTDIFDQIEIDNTPITTFTNTSVAGANASSTTYSFQLNVNGAGATTITITTPVSPTPYTYYQLLLDIADEMDTLALPASVNLEQRIDFMDLVFVTNDTGAGKTITLTDVTLFAALTTTIPTIHTSISGSTYAYTQVGTPWDDSTQITFNSPTQLNAVYELLVSP